jgi:hypothetical protein
MTDGRGQRADGNRTKQHKTGTAKKKDLKELSAKGLWIRHHSTEHAADFLAFIQQILVLICGNVGALI